jgi:hypothetical protein
MQKNQKSLEQKNLETKLGLNYLDPDSVNILIIKLPTIEKASKNGDLETVKYLFEIGKKVLLQLYLILVDVDI